MFTPIVGQSYASTQDVTFYGYAPHANGTVYVCFLNSAALDPAIDSNWTCPLVTQPEDNSLATWSGTITRDKFNADAWPKGGVARLRAVFQDWNDGSWSLMSNASVWSNWKIVLDTSASPANDGHKFLTKGYSNGDSTETRRYYDSVGTGSDGGGPSISDSLSNLDRFIDRYFPSGIFKANAGYYNRGDLGLWRSMSCSWNAANSEAACLVGNYAPVDPDTKAVTFGAGARAARDGDNFATVAMVYRANAPALNRTFFAVYDAGRDLTDGEVKLDHGEGNTFNPGNCTTCHGGTYDPQSHGVSGATFLPFNLDNFDFLSPEERTNQLASFRSLNDIATIAQRSDAGFDGGVWNLMKAWYRDASEPTVFNGNNVPDGWSGDDKQVELFRKVVGPFCITCHVASPRVPFDTYEQFARLAPAIAQDVCGSHAMPNAERTMAEFWSDPGRAVLLSWLDENGYRQGCKVNRP